MKIGRATVERGRGGSGGWIVFLLLGLAALLIAGGLFPRFLDSVSIETETVSIGQPAEGPAEQPAETSEPEAVAPEAEPADLPEAVPEQATPEDLPAIVDAYFAALDANDLNRALRHATAYMKAAPDDAYGYALRGYAHWLRGRCDRAIGDLDKAIALSPDYGYALFVRGSCRFALVRLDDAATDAAAALIHAQTGEEAGYAQELQGWIAYARGRFEDAGEAFAGAGRVFAEAGRSAGMSGVGFLLSATRAGEPITGDLDAEGLNDTQVLAANVLMGERPRADLEAAADTDGLAAFYLAQYALLEGRGEEAKELLERYTRRGFSPDVERAVARVQLVGLR